MGLTSLVEVLKAAEESLQAFEEARQIASERRHLAQQMRRENISVPFDLEHIAPPPTDGMTRAETMNAWYDWRKRIQEEQRDEMAHVEDWAKRIRRLKRHLEKEASNMEHGKLQTRFP